MRKNYYNPSFLTDSELIETFSVRHLEFRSIVRTVRECTGPSNSHMLVIGPRGSGKTTLLLRVVAELRRDYDLASSFFPITLAEETYNVANCGEFWLEVLYRLAYPVPHHAKASDLRPAYDEFRRSPDNHSLADRCLGCLIDFSIRESKRLVIFVENLNSILSQMVDKQAAWQIRHTLQTEPRIMLVGSATSRFDGIDDPSKAFYGFFQIRTLRPLTEVECADLWKGILGKRPPRSTVRSLQILTGGNPRLLAMIARFGATYSFEELMSNLLDLVDNHTEYFRSYLEAMPYQKRRVFLALAGLWRPSTTREIALEAGISTNQCSAQLRRLEQLGAVIVSGGSPRRKKYYLTERMYNIYYLLRFRNKTSDLVTTLVRFMQSYYSLQEQTKVVRRIVSSEVSEDSIHREVMDLTMSQLLKGFPEHLEGDILQSKPVDIGENKQNSLTGSGKRNLREISQAVPIEDVKGLVTTGKFKEAIKVCNRVVRRYGTSSSPQTLSIVASAIVDKGVANMQLGHFDKALEAFAEVDKRFRYEKSQTILDSVAMALVNKGITLGCLNRIEEALDCFVGIVNCFDGKEHNNKKPVVACALFQIGVLSDRVGRRVDALRAYQELVSQFGDETEFEIEKWVAKGNVNRAFALSRLGRIEESLAAYEQIKVEEFEFDVLDSRECIVKALIGKARVLQQLDRLEEALAIYDHLLDVIGSSAIADFAPAVAESLSCKGFVLEKLEHVEEALTAYGELFDRFYDTQNEDVIEVVATGLNNKGALLSDLGRMEAAYEAFNSAAVLCLNFGSEQVSTYIETALLNRSLIEGELGRFDIAVQTASQVLERASELQAKIRMKALFVRAYWQLNSGEVSAGERDIHRALEQLPMCEMDLSSAIDWLIRYTGTLGNAKVLELINVSPVRELLVPLSTALEQELGRETRVAIEVAEVALDVRWNLRAIQERKYGDL